MWFSSVGSITNPCPVLLRTSLRVRDAEPSAIPTSSIWHPHFRQPQSTNHGRQQLTETPRGSRTPGHEPTSVLLRPRLCLGRLSTAHSSAHRADDRSAIPQTWHAAPAVCLEERLQTLRRHVHTHHPLEPRGRVVVCGGHAGRLLLSVDRSGGPT